MLFFGGAFGGEGDKSGEVAAHFDFINKEPGLLTGADVPFGHFAVVYGFDFNIAGRGIGAGAGELVLHALFLPLADSGELGVVELCPRPEGLAVGGDAHFDAFGEENPGAHVVETIDRDGGEGFGGEEVDDHFHVGLPALPASNTEIGSAVETVDEAIGAILAILWCRLGDVA